MVLNAPGTKEPGIITVAFPVVLLYDQPSALFEAATYLYPHGI